MSRSSRNSKVCRLTFIFGESERDSCSDMMPYSRKFPSMKDAVEFLGNFVADGTTTDEVHIYLLEGPD